MDEQRNWLERLGDSIPGYHGYVAREARRDVDRLHREHLAERLRAAKRPLTETMRELSATGRLFEVGPLDRALKKLDHVENRVRHASYGYSGFFDTVKIDEAQLDALYQFDLALVEKVDEVERLARETATAAPDGLKETAARVEHAVDELGNTFDLRHRVIDEFR